MHVTLKVCGLRSNLVRQTRLGCSRKQLLRSLPSPLACHLAIDIMFLLGNGLYFRIDKYIYRSECD